MISLALLGKDISHSQSPRIYKKLLKRDHSYSLLDYASEESIPSLDEIFKTYDGLSITAPYKRVFLEQLIMDFSIQNLRAVNCIRKILNNKFEGTNTDYLAVKKILRNLQDKYGELEVVLLGDGAMSFITQNILEEERISFRLFSRKNTPDLSNLNITQSEQGKTLLVINSCARAFVFKGILPKEALFWDYNYDFKPHEERLSGNCLSYMDGIEMLELQAQFALDFWGFAD